MHFWIAFALFMAWVQYGLVGVDNNGDYKMM